MSSYIGTVTYYFSAAYGKLFPGPASSVGADSLPELSEAEHYVALAVEKISISDPDHFTTKKEKEKQTAQRLARETAESSLVRKMAEDALFLDASFERIGKIEEENAVACLQLEVFKEAKQTDEMIAQANLLGVVANPGYLFCYPTAVSGLVHLSGLDHLCALREEVMRRFPGSHEGFIKAKYRPDADAPLKILRFYQKIEATIARKKEEFFKDVFIKIDPRAEIALHKLLDSAKARQMLDKILQSRPFYIRVGSWSFQDLKSFACAFDERTIYINEKALKESSNPENDMLFGLLFELGNLSHFKEASKIINDFKEKIKAVFFLALEKQRTRKTATFEEIIASDRELTRMKEAAIQERTMRNEFLEHETDRLTYSILEEGVENFDWDEDHLREKAMSELSAEERFKDPSMQWHVLITEQRSRNLWNEELDALIRAHHSYFGLEGSAILIP